MKCKTKRTARDSYKHRKGIQLQTTTKRRSWAFGHLGKIVPMVRNSSTVAGVRFPLPPASTHLVFVVR